MAHVGQCDTSYPSRGALILFRKSVLSRKISCAMLLRLSSCDCTTLYHSLTFTLAHMLSLSSCKNPFGLFSPISRLLRFICSAHQYTFKTQVTAVPAKPKLFFTRRLLSPIAVYSVLPFLFCICQNLSGPRHVSSETFPHFSRELFHAKCFPHLVSIKPCSQPFPSTLRRHSSLTLLQPPFIVTLLAQVDRMSPPSLFCHNGHKLVELAALFSTLVMGHVQGPGRLTDCTWDKAQLLHLFPHFHPSNGGSET